ncbi:MAG TPA: hypothetical protein EYN93_16090, partial [Planctomycetaceae bacterium]|nr:hypothetical protein [Planctomycetaceae bacterium]
RLQDSAAEHKWRSAWSLSRPPLESCSDVAVGRELLAELSSQSGHECVAEAGELYVYNTSLGIWEPVDEIRAAQLVQGYEGRPYYGGFEKDGRPKIKKLQLRKHQVDGAVSSAVVSAHKARFFEEALSGICVANGVLQITAQGAKLLPHSPEHRMRVALPFEYHAASQAPRWQQYLQEVFDGADGGSSARLLQEFVGACLLGQAPRWQKCLVLYGTGANGKSATGEVLSGLFPSNACSSVRPHDLGHEYSRAMLVGKYLNVVGDMPSGNIKSTDLFKAVVVGDEIQARNPYHRVFSFRPRAGHLFSTNEVLHTRDTSKGYWRRFMILEYSVEFQGANEVKGLGKRIVKSELPGVLTWAVQGAVRLLQNDEYTVPESSLKLIAEWRKSADQVAIFVHEKCRPVLARVVGASSYTSTATLYVNYGVWAENSGHRALSKSKFSRRLKALGYEQQRTAGCRGYPLQVLECIDEPFDWDSYQRAQRKANDGSMTDE